MKTFLPTLILAVLASMAYSQNASVVPSTWGIQAGPIGIWAHNESKLSNQFVLRSEVGFNGSILNSDFYDNSRVLFQPEITIEPRWYYNLQKRANKSRRIDGNSGNFFSLKTTYRPDWFTISNYDDFGGLNDLSIIPTWGIRRNLGKHFTYEAGIGAGYRLRLGKLVGDRGEPALNLHLRIGYRF